MPEQEPKLEEIKLPGAIMRRVVNPFKPPVRRRIVELKFPGESDSKKCSKETVVTAGPRKERDNFDGKNEPGPSGVRAVFSKVTKAESASTDPEPSSSQEDANK